MLNVRELVATVARDDAALHSLRFDPVSLARSANLNTRQLRALQDAARFFETEVPILDRPADVSGAASSTPPVRERSQALAPPSSLAATADTGTLLTGPTTGTYTISSSATATVSAAPPAPGPPSPAPGPPSPAPGPTPPAPRPPVPPVTPIPPAPRPPVGPPSPVIPCPPVIPQPPVGPSAPPAQLVPARCDHACAAAVTAMVATAGATADTAITAITALTGQARRGRSKRRRAPSDGAP